MCWPYSFGIRYTRFLLINGLRGRNVLTNHRWLVAGNSMEILSWQQLTISISALSWKGRRRSPSSTIIMLVYMTNWFWCLWLVKGVFHCLIFRTRWYFFEGWYFGGSNWYGHLLNPNGIHDVACFHVTLVWVCVIRWHNYKDQ